MDALSKYYNYEEQSANRKCCLARLKRAREERREQNCTKFIQPIEYKTSRPYTYVRRNSTQAVAMPVAPPTAAVPLNSYQVQIRDLINTVADNCKKEESPPLTYKPYYAPLIPVRVDTLTARAYCTQCECLTHNTRHSTKIVDSAQYQSSSEKKRSTYNSGISIKTNLTEKYKYPIKTPLLASVQNYCNELIAEINTRLVALEADFKPPSDNKSILSDSIHIETSSTGGDHLGDIVVSQVKLKQNICRSLSKVNFRGNREQKHKLYDTVDESSILKANYSHSDNCASSYPSSSSSRVSTEVQVQKVNQPEDKFSYRFMRKDTPLSDIEFEREVLSKIFEPVVCKIKRLYIGHLNEEMEILDQLERAGKDIVEVYKKNYIWGQE